MSKRKIAGIVLVSIPFVVWYVVGVASFGWVIPTGAYLVFMGFALGVWLLVK